ncbi:hypothetical protein ARSEF4850_004312 [Beauveria asiatica]
MDDFGDSDQGPNKRVRLDQAGAGQGDAPREGHEDGFPVDWGTSQSVSSGWIYPLTTDPLPMSISGSSVGIGPNSKTTMPTSSFMTVPMISSVDNSMAKAPWDMHFHIAPDPNGILAPYLVPWQQAISAVEDGQQLSQSLPFRPSLQSQALQSQPPPPLQPSPRRYQAQPSHSSSLASEPVHSEKRRRKPRSKHAYTSPFFDCLGSFGCGTPREKFPRPSDGKVNGYIKFSWPSKENTRNWCPGRSVLTKTNLWLTDFASMQSPGVLAAIQSLAGIYVYDYLPDDTLRRRVNEKFAIAEARLSELLQDTSRNDDQSSELVTLASLLSMQDVVLTERRLQKPDHPRWLMGSRQAERVLQLTDTGSRFYKEENVQVSSLRLSQSVIVGRAVILAQLMMPLPPLANFNWVAETSRFGFLLYGSEAGIYEIHGGCGFSRRLLHIFSQVTDCSTRMLQDAETPIVPVTARMLYNQLLQLHQWSGEYDSWEAAMSRPQSIEWIRQTDESYIVQEAKQMTEVTAEALPRNHYMVIENIADLAKCISIMPTSGRVFTAQAPLLPVFFLGLLATVEEHIQVAEIWFQQVIQTPVRSSVPPLYQTLTRIQSWMELEIPVPAPNVEVPRAIAERQPWWEHMVSKVQAEENEVLCVT